LEEFKQTEKVVPVQLPRIPASERIEHELGREYVERHREEVKDELKSDVMKFYKVSYR